MDVKQEIYASGNKWTGRVSTVPSTYESSLFSKYYEPTIDAGGTIDDGIVSYALTASTKYVSQDSPISQLFDPTALGISLAVAGQRAQAYVTVITDRIETAMDILRAVDGTSAELTKWKVV